VRESWLRWGATRPLVAAASATSTAEAKRWSSTDGRAAGGQPGNAALPTGQVQPSRVPEGDSSPTDALKPLRHALPAEAGRRTAAAWHQGRKCRDRGWASPTTRATPGPAPHAAPGPTPPSRPMFGECGRAAAEAGLTTAVPPRQHRGARRGRRDSLRSDGVVGHRRSRREREVTPRWPTHARSVAACGRRRSSTWDETGWKREGR